MRTLRSTMRDWGANAGGGGERYDPGMMTFDGSTGTYVDSSLTTSGNAVTLVARVNVAPRAGSAHTAFYVGKTAVGFPIVMLIVASDGTIPNKIYIRIQNDALTTICQLASTVVAADSADHMIFFDYDGTAGTARLRMDGADVDDAGWGIRIVVTGTIAVGAGAAYVGSNSATADYLNGQLGYAGMRMVSGLDPDDFYDPVAGLQEIDESGWTEWGAQPLYWNQFGTMTDNKGSAGNMTENGTITGPS